MEELCPFLPQDVMMDEILVRLPVESIGRFRCVSKPWLRLLSSPQFVKAHLNRHLHDPESFVYSLYNPSIATLNSRGGDFDCVLGRVNIPPDMEWRVEAACHGLLLLSSTEKGMILVNPITAESTEIPDLCFGSRDDCKIVYGLGYDSFRDDYKIVSVLLGGCPCYDGYKDHDRMDIYSVKSKTWRRLANSPYHCLWPARGVYLSGCIHWWAVKADGSSLIAAFNLALEEFEEVPLPVRLSSFIKLTVLHERLALLVDDGLGYLNLWVMKEYGVKDSWFIIKPGIRIIPDDLEYMELNDGLIGLLGDEVIVDMYRGRYFVAYNWRNGVGRNLVIPGFPKGGKRVTGFIASLVSPRYL